MTNTQVTYARVNVFTNSITLTWSDRHSDGGTYASVPRFDADTDTAQIAEFKAEAARRWPNAVVKVRYI